LERQSFRAPSHNLRRLFLRITVSFVTAVLVTSATLAAGPLIAGCDHPYFPMKQGEKYVYAKQGIQITEVLTKMNGSSFTFESMADGKAGAASAVAVTSIGECSADGLTMDIAGVTTSRGTKIKILKHSGTDFGAPAQMKVGGSWSAAVSKEVTTGNVTMTIDTKFAYRVVAAERVKVPAGEYDALKVESDVHQSMTASGPGAAQIPKREPTHNTITMWIVKGVGLVKSQSSATEPGDPPFPAMELVSFSK
jgi:hypothetical protein